MTVARCVFGFLLVCIPACTKLRVVSLGNVPKPPDAGLQLPAAAGAVAPPTAAGDTQVRSEPALAGAGMVVAGQPGVTDTGMTPLIDPADPRARSDGGTSPSPAADDADDADDDDESDESDESDGDG